MSTNSPFHKAKRYLGASRCGYAVLIAVLALVIVIGTSPVSAQSAEVTMPQPTGSYSVGRTIYEWTDSSRPERYSDDPAAKRELQVWVWYPADPALDIQPDAYLPGMLGQVVSQAFGVNFDAVHTFGYADAPLAGSESPYPVLIFSHGNNSFLGTYSALLEEIASHGYVVVGISHTYNVPVSVFSDGRIIPQSQASVENESVAYWVEDTAFVVDQLDMLNNGDDRFGGKLDLSRLGIIGHSFGGATAADFCLLDARCTAGINLDGTLWGEAGTQGVAKPFMQIFSDHTVMTCEEIVAAGGAPSVEACQASADMMQNGWQNVFESAEVGYDVTIAGSVHNNFTDDGFLVPVIPPLAAYLAGATIDPERAWRVTADYALAFFGKYLNGEDSPLLDAPSSDYPEVTFEMHER